MKIQKLNEDVGLLSEPNKTAKKSARSGDSGQTSLKEYIVDAINKTLGKDLSAEDYCVHHLFGEHSNNSVDEVSVTTIENHDKLTNYMRYCNWDGVKESLQQCYVLKVYAQRLIDKDIDKIINELKRREKIVYEPKTKRKWRIFSYDIWHIAEVVTSDKNKMKYHEFETKEDLDAFVKRLESRR